MTAIPDLREIRAALAFCLVCSTIGVGCSSQRNVSDRDLNVVGVQRVREVLGGGDGVLLLDARAPELFEAGHLPGAANLTLPEVDPAYGRDPAIERFDMIVVYGEDAASAPARALAKRMMRLKYDDVVFFQGGLRAWREAGLRVETGPGRGIPR